MKETDDTWFIRLPDGKVVRAASTQAVRQQLGSGRIPAGSMVRRSPEEEWVTLNWTREFADLAEVHLRHHEAAGAPVAATHEPEASEPATVASRLDPNRLRTVGVRGAVEELLAALDSTLVRNKMLVGSLAGLLMGCCLALSRLGLLAAEVGGWPAAWLAAGLVLGVVSAATAAVLTRLTFVEVSRLRPAHLRECLAGSSALTARIILGQLLIVGSVGVVILLLSAVPTWLPLAPEQDGHGPGLIGAGAAVVVSQILQVALVPLFFLSLLLAPILVVERCSTWSALSHWFGLLRQHMGRAFCYEALALGVGIIVTLPFALPLALLSRPEEPRLLQTALVTRDLLLGLALVPLFVYAIVVNVFIYLHIRYGSNERA
jgi:hypothetical protein